MASCAGMANLLCMEILGFYTCIQEYRLACQAIFIPISGRHVPQICYKGRVDYLSPIEFFKQHYNYGVRGQGM
jgi:hypothetical protein